MQSPNASPLKTLLKPALVLAFSTVFLSACAFTPEPPTQSLTEARRTIADAEQADARQYAGAQLDEARRQMAMAQAAVEDEQMTEAERYARQAQLAAELAMARSEAAKAEEINHEMRRSTQALLEEMRRTGDRS